jgi:hypothetical protein
MTFFRHARFASTGKLRGKGLNFVEGKIQKVKKKVKFRGGKVKFREKKVIFPILFRGKKV